MAQARNRWANLGLLGAGVLGAWLSPGNAYAEALAVTDGGHTWLVTDDGRVTVSNETAPAKGTPPRVETSRDLGIRVSQGPAVNGAPGDTGDLILHQGNDLVPLLGESSVKRDWSVSADGKWLAFTSTRNHSAPRDPNNDDLYVISLETGEEELLPVNSASRPGFASDGSVWYYRKQQLRKGPKAGLYRLTRGKKGWQEKAVKLPTGCEVEWNPKLLPYVLLQTSPKCHKFGLLDPRNGKTLDLSSLDGTPVVSGDADRIAYLSHVGDTPVFTVMVYTVSTKQNDIVWSGPDDQLLLTPDAAPGAFVGRHLVYVAANSDGEQQASLWSDDGKAQVLAHGPDTRWFTPSTPATTPLGPRFALSQVATYLANLSAGATAELAKQQAPGYQTVGLADGDISAAGPIEAGDYVHAYLGMIGPSTGNRADYGSNADLDALAAKSTWVFGFAMERQTAAAPDTLWLAVGVKRDGARWLVTGIVGQDVFRSPNWRY